MDRGKGSLLGAFGMLGAIPAADLARCVRRAQPSAVRRREKVWVPGDAVEHLHFVRSGVVRISVPHAGTLGLTLSYHAKGELIGEVGCLQRCVGRDAVRHSEAVAHDDAVVYALPVADLQRLIDLSPTVATQLGALAAERRGRLERRLGVLPYRSVPSRMAAMLLELAEQFGVRDSRGVIVNLRLTHRQLASLVGATRETVSAVLSDFRRSGWLEVEAKRVVLLERHALEQLAAEEPGATRSGSG